MIRIGYFVIPMIFLSLSSSLQSGDKKDTGVTVDKKKRVVKIDAKIAPRKLAHLKGEIYPIEVIACWPHPKGKKAHETVVTIEAMPSDVHKALESLGIKPGTPVLGGEEEVPKGPVVLVYLEIPAADGGVKKVTMDKAMLDPKTQKPFPKMVEKKPVEFRFTGSVMSQPDPNEKKTVYGADMTGTLVAIFPVTNQTVLQTSLPMKYEKFLKLETNTKILPPEGTAVKLVIEVPAK
jgi:hypothetical protein